MSNTRHRLIDNTNTIIHCNLKPEEIKILESIESQSKKLDSTTRAGKLSSDIGTVFGFTNDKDHISSSQLFKVNLSSTLNSIPHIKNISEEIKKEQNKNTSRLIHNLTSLNAHNIQEIYSLISQESMSNTKEAHIKYVENVIKEDPREAAITILRIAKNNAAMKTEFSVFKKLFTTNPSLSKKNHNTHKVLMNVFYLFFPDFTDKDVKVIVGDEHIRTAYFDYESIHVALYHLIENTTKYIKPKTQLNIIIAETEKNVEIKFDMISVQIKESERKTIFEEGISGDLSIKLGKSGEGIGLSRVKKIIELNSGEIEVLPFPETLDDSSGFPYQRNIFTMKLPKK